MKRTKRRGQALVEFAIISFVLTALLAGFLGIIVMGLGSFQNNIAAESAGRILDEHPALIKENFAELFNDDASVDYFDAATTGYSDITARQVYRLLNEYEVDGDQVEDNSPVLYDERLLVLSPAVFRTKLDPRTGLAFPEINQSLLGQYIFDPDLIPEGEINQGAYRFPGAVVERTVGGDTYQTVLIPLLPKPSDEAPVIIDPLPDPETPRGIDRSFYVTSSAPELFYPVSDDWVAPVVVGKVQDGGASNFRIIMFHPSQPASMVQIRLSLDENGRPLRDENGHYQFPVEADDDAIDALIGDPPSEYTLAPPPVNSSLRSSPNVTAPYGGEYGLGESYAFLKTVRPYRAVFETSSLFRMGASPIAAKYEASGSAIPLNDASLNVPTTDSLVGPFLAYENNRDQGLAFGQLVIDQSTESLRRYLLVFTPDMPPAVNNDFRSNVLALQPNDDGTWRVTVATEFVRADGSMFADGHELELRLYKNGVYERSIDAYSVDASGPTTIPLRNNVLTPVSSGDVLQVRVFTASPGGAYNNVHLTGTKSMNWVSFERIAD